MSMKRIPPHLEGLVSEYVAGFGWLCTEHQQPLALCPVCEPEAMRRKKEGLR